MFIKIEETDNDRIRNYYPDTPLRQEGRTEFADTKALRKSPLAEAVFDIGGIESIILAPDMISVVRKEDADWNVLNPQIMATLMYFATTEADICDRPVPEQAPEDLMTRISALTEARIRPALRADGGDVKICGFSNGILEVELIGKCACCPYAMQTLKGGIEKTLRTYIPEISEVKAVKNGKER